VKTGFTAVRQNVNPNVHVKKYVIMFM